MADLTLFRKKNSTGSSLSDREGPGSPEDKQTEGISVHGYGSPSVSAIFAVAGRYARKEFIIEKVPNRQILV